MSADYYKTLIKDIIENNEKEKAIEIIANKLNEKQTSNEKEILTNLDKDKEIERLKNIIKEVSKELKEFNEEYLVSEGDHCVYRYLNKLIEKLKKGE